MTTYEHPEERSNYVGEDSLPDPSDPDTRSHLTHIERIVGRFGHTTWHAVCSCGWTGAARLLVLNAEVDATLHPVEVAVGMAS